MPMPVAYLLAAWARPLHCSSVRAFKCCKRQAAEPTELQYSVSAVRPALLQERERAGVCAPTRLKVRIQKATVWPTAVV